MSWIILAAFLVVTLLFIATPLLSRAKRDDRHQPAQLSEVRGHLKHIEDELSAGRASPEAAGEMRRSLELRALEILDNSASAHPHTGKVKASAIAAAATLIVGAVSLYATVGAPSFDRTAVRAADLSLQSPQDLPLDVLVAGLEQKLSNDPNPPANGYLLLGRSLMTLERYDDALAAYRRAIELSPTNDAYKDEFGRAQAFAASRTGLGPPIDEAALRAVENMSPEERENLIDGMVERLAMRLSEDPSDIDGWRRLLRARTVTNDIEKAQNELNTGIAALSEAPVIQARLIELAHELGFEIAQ